MNQPQTASFLENITLSDLLKYLGQIQTEGMLGMIQWADIETCFSQVAPQKSKQLFYDLVKGAYKTKEKETLESCFGNHGREKGFTKSDIKQKQKLFEFDEVNDMFTEIESMFVRYSQEGKGKGCQQSLAEFEKRYIRYTTQGKAKIMAEQAQNQQNLVNQETSNQHQDQYANLNDTATNSFKDNEPIYSLDSVNGEQAQSSQNPKSSLKHSNRKFQNTRMVKFQSVSKQHSAKTNIRNQSTNPIFEFPEHVKHLGLLKQIRAVVENSEDGDVMRLFTVNDLKEKKFTRPQPFSFVEKEKPVGIREAKNKAWIKKHQNHLRDIGKQVFRAKPIPKNIYKPYKQMGRKYRYNF